MNSAIFIAMKNLLKCDLELNSAIFIDDNLVLFELSFGDYKVMWEILDFSSHTGFEELLKIVDLISASLYLVNEKTFLVAKSKGLI